MLVDHRDRLAELQMDPEHPRLLNALGRPWR